MAYNKTVWKDQDVENPRTYTQRQNDDGSVTLLDHFGKITELGTPVNAENMNKIEQGIVDEEHARSTADAALTKNLDTEIKNRTNADAALQTQINKKVNKSGDTMTGRIDFKNNYDLIWNITPAAGNTQMSMVLGNSINQDGTTYTNLATRKIVNGKELYSVLQTFITADGQIGTSCPGCKFDNAILTAVHNELDAVLLGNMLILNWGEIAVGDNQTVPVVLKIPYRNTNYIVVFGHNNQAAGGTDFYHPQIVYTTKTTTGFSIYNRCNGSYHLSNVTWFAIGL